MNDEDLAFMDQCLDCANMADFDRIVWGSVPERMKEAQIVLRWAYLTFCDRAYGNGNTDFLDLRLKESNEIH